MISLKLCCPVVVLLFATLLVGAASAELPDTSSLPTPVLKRMAATVLAGIEKAKRESDETLAAELSVGLKRVLRDLDANAIPVRDDKTPAQLHGIGFYDANGAVIRVTDRSHPLILAISGYSPATWTFQIGDGVKIKKVLVTSVQPQTLNGLPKDVEVEEIGRLYAHTKESRAFDNWQRQLRKFTELPMITFTGNYAVRDGEAEIVIGHESETWVRKRSSFYLNQLVELATRKERLAFESKLKRHRFRSVFLRGGNGRPSVHVAEFSVSGPIQPTMQAIVGMEHRQRLALSSDGARLVGFSGQGGRTVDIKAGTSKAWPISDDIEKVSWPVGVAFDSKRNRLIGGTLGGEGFLYGLDLNSGKWSIISSLENRDLSGLVYDEESDSIYALQAAGGSESYRGAILRYDAKGKMVDSFHLKLAKPIGMGHSYEVQLAVFNNYLAILTFDTGHRSSGTAPMIQVINLKEKRAVYEGELRPHLGNTKLSEKELTELWNALIKSNDDKSVTATIQRLGAGGESTVKFLAGQLKQEKQLFDEATVGKLIKQLDSDSFRERQLAQQTLDEIGPVIRSRIERALEGELSGEASTRLKNLLNGWKAGESQNPELRKFSRAISVLRYMKTTEAVKLLRSLDHDSAVGGLARKALSEIEQD